MTSRIRPTDFVADNTDCDDTNNTAFPGNAETWYDSADNDCSGGSDYASHSALNARAQSVR
jgi:hypothetical protein